MPCAIIGLGELCPNPSENFGWVSSLGAGVATQTSRAVDIDDLDEALYWASTAGARGPDWANWVDKLLDERLTLTPLPPYPQGQQQEEQKNQQQETKSSAQFHRPTC